MPLLSTIGLGAVFAREGEAATYHKAGGSQRQILAIVDREPATTMQPGDGVPTSVVRVQVRNDATAGIAATELDRGKDRLQLAVRIGEAPRMLQFGVILHQDPGVLVLEVR